MLNGTTKKDLAMESSNILTDTTEMKMITNTTTETTDPLETTDLLETTDTDTDILSCPFQT